MIGEAAQGSQTQTRTHAQITHNIQQQQQTVMNHAVKDTELLCC